MSLESRFERVDSGILPAYVELNNAEYSANPICYHEHLEWKYLKNPQGASYAAHLYDGSRLVGRIVFAPRWLWKAGVVYRAANPIDLLIHPAYRGLAAFIKLMAVEDWRDHFDGLFLVPNTNSLMLYERALKWQSPVSLGALGGPVRTARLFEHVTGWNPGSMFLPIDQLLKAGTWSLPAGLEFRQEWPSPTELDDLFEREQAAWGWIGERSAAFLTWRLLEGPLVKYRTTFMYRDGTLEGYYATGSQRYMGFDTMFLMDVFGTANLTPIQWWNVRARVLQAAVKARCDVVFGLFNPSALRPQPSLGWPFARIPRRLLPQALPLVVRPSSQAPTSVDWREATMSPLDLDVF